MMKELYKVGDVIILKKDLKIGDSVEGLEFSKYMEGMQGTQFLILDEDSYSYKISKDEVAYWIVDEWIAKKQSRTV